MSQKINLGPRDQVLTGESKVFTVEGKKIAVFNIEGSFFAVDDTCTHAQYSLAPGVVQEKVVTCPAHGARFDLTTGKAVGGPARGNLGCYKIQIEGNDMKIEIP